MTDNSDNGAFPQEVHSNSGDIIGGGRGLSKRELFAAMCLQGMLCDGERSGNYKDYAVDAVQFADALISALKGGS